MFGLRRVLNGTSIRICRRYATGTKLIDVTHDNETGISIVSMARPPVNGLNKDLLHALKSSLTDVQKNRGKGVILTSSLPTVFSGGLDILEMYNRDTQSMTEFWQSLQDMWLTLYGLEIPVAAAINGASPAGGCMLALSCEYRVMVGGKHTIGLNETQLGIIAPRWFTEMYIDTIGYRNAEKALLRGSLFSPEEALRIGLIDELAADKTNAIEKCQDYILQFKNMSHHGRAGTKLALRKRNLQWMEQNRKQDVNQFLSFLQLPQVQDGLKLYIESLKRKQ